MNGMRALTLAMGLLTQLIIAQNSIDPYRYLATLEFDGEDWSLPTQVENVFPVRFGFNTTQDANSDGLINPEDNLENIIEYAIGNNLTGTGRTGLPNRGPNDQRPAVYYHYVDIYPWRVHQYWLYYPDNDWLNNHEHDWEFYFVYTINGVPTHVGYSGHGFITIETWCNIQKDLVDPSHPRLGVDGGAHAMKNSGEDGVRIRFDGVIEKRNGRLNFNIDTIPWVIYSNDPNVINVVPYIQSPDTFWYEDPYYGGSEYGDPRLAPWRRTRWTNPEMPSGQPVVPQLPDTIYKCLGDTVTLDAGPGGSQYLWSTGETTQTIDVVAPGKYWVNVISSADGCTYTIPDTVVVIDYPVIDPTTIIAEDTIYKCYYQDSIWLVADSGYAFYGWSTGDIGQSIQVGTQGIYVAYVIDTFGCSWKDSVWVLDITYKPSFSADTITKCVSDSVVLSAINAISYLWNTGDSFQTIIAYGSGTYSVIAIDSQGCAQPDTITILNFPVPTILNYDTVFLCLYQDSALLTANPGFVSYQWSTGDTTKQIIITVQGTYMVRVIDSFGCLFIDTVHALYYPMPSDIIPETYISKCEGDTVIIDANSGFVSYQWNTGDSTSSIQAIAEGTYFVIVVDTFGCSFIDSVSVVDSIYQRGLFFSSLSSDGRCYMAIYQNIDSVKWWLDTVFIGDSDSVCVSSSGLLCLYGFSMCYVDTFCSQVYVLPGDSDTISSVSPIEFDKWSNCELKGIFDVTGRKIGDLNQCVEMPCLIEYTCSDGSDSQSIRFFKVIITQELGQRAIFGIEKRFRK